ncbi:MAG TPA: ABC transporter permease [Rubrobacteraceae bacterium]|nr:ABC transporter permease [Rubrobacteraceae bacterium]
MDVSENGMQPALPGPGRVLLDQFGYQLRLLSRAPRAAFSAFLLPVLLLAAFHLSGSYSGSAGLALVGGLTAFGVIMTGYATHAGGVVAARERGVLKRLRGGPLPPWAYFSGSILATTTLCLLSATVTLLVARMLGTQVRLAEVPALFLVTLLGALSWAALGTAVTAFIPDVGSAGPLLSATYLPVVFVSGVFVPVAFEPGWLVTLASWLPAEPFIHALSAVLKTGGPGIPMPPAGDVLGSALWAVVGIYVALRHFRWEPRGGEHKGASGLAEKKAVAR